MRAPLSALPSAPLPSPLSSPLSRLLPAVLVCLLCTLAGCMPGSGDALRQPAPPEAATAAWTAFEQYTKDRAAASGPFRIQCALRYSDAQGDGRRVTAVIWSNGDLPVRLDVMAGVGALVGRIRQSDSSLVIHAPRDNKAWTYQGRGKAFLAFGMPVPLTMPDLIAVMQGHYRSVFGPAKGMNPYMAGEGDIAFRLEGGNLPGTVTLTPGGLLKSWQEAPGAWTMRVTYDDGTPPLPQEIEIDHPEGQHAVLSVKERQRPTQAFTDAQLNLELPTGVVTEALKQAAR